MSKWTKYRDGRGDPGQPQGEGGGGRAKGHTVSEDERFEGIGDGEQDVEELEIASDCLYLRGEDQEKQDEVAHHLRYQSGTVHGAGKRLAGFRREPVVGELLEVETEPVEGLGSSIRETE